MGKEDLLTVFFEEREMDTVELIGRITRQEVFFHSMWSLVLLRPKYEKGREFMFVEHSLWPINSPQDPRLQ